MTCKIDYNKIKQNISFSKTRSRMLIKNINVINTRIKLCVRKSDHDGTRYIADAIYSTKRTIIKKKKKKIFYNEPITIISPYKNPST